VFVPLAKWAMLISGNYRCVTKTGIRPIKEAVHSDLNASREMYNWVVKLCVSLGANEKDLVPFEKYAAAAQSLGSPSSAARALDAGAQNIERVDRLVQTIAKSKGMRSATLDETVALVDAKLDSNRKAQPATAAAGLAPEKAKKTA
jgi:predicted esterase